MVPSPAKPARMLRVGWCVKPMISFSATFNVCSRPPEATENEYLKPLPHGFGPKSSEIHVKSHALRGVSHLYGTQNTH